MATWYDTIQVAELPRMDVSEGHPPIRYKRMNCVIDLDQVIYCAEFVNSDIVITNYTRVHLAGDAGSAFSPLVIDIDYHAFRALL